MANDGGDFARSMSIATSGLKAQAGRMRVISENIANADSTAVDRRRRSLPAQGPDLFLRTRPLAGRQGGDAGQGQARIQSAFRVKYEPSNPAADAAGNVKYPNVNSVIEMTDMREAQRSYEANLNIISRHAADDSTHARHPQGLNRKP